MFYKVIKREDPSDRTKDGKFYCSPKSMGVLEMIDIAREIEFRSSLTVGDVMSVLDNLVDIVPEKAKLGYSSRLGRLGTFVPTFRSEGSDQEEDCSVRSIHSVRLSFRASEELRDSLKEAHFEQIK